MPIAFGRKRQPLKNQEPHQQTKDIGDIVAQVGRAAPKEKSLHCLGSRRQQDAQNQYKETAMEFQNRPLRLLVERLANQKSPNPKDPEMHHQIGACDL